MKKTTFEEWLLLDDAARLEIIKSWNVYAGEGEEIVTAIATAFQERFKGIDGLTFNRPGVYHGGDWVIGVTIGAGYEVSLPDTFLGIRVNKGYMGLSHDLENKLRVTYKDNVAMFAEGEFETFSHACPVVFNSILVSLW